MAPKKSAKKTVAFEDEVVDGPPPPEQPVIEEIVDESEEPVREVSFVVADPGDEDHPADEDEEDEDEELHEEDDELVATVGQLGQLLMTDDGEAITDVLAGIRDALDKQNKILYRGLQLLEKR